MEGKELSSAGFLATSLGGLIEYFIGLDWELFFIAFTMSALDIIVGSVFACKESEYESSKMREGLLTKAIEWIVLIATILLQRMLMINNFVQIPIPMSGFLAGAFVFKDFMSLFETANKAGCVIPKSIKSWIDKSYAVYNDFNVGEDKEDNKN